MFETASEIVIWMVLAALVGFATGWALRSVVANRTRARLSERLEEKRRETQELREELRHLRGGDDVMQVPQLPGDDPGVGGRRRVRRGASARSRPWAPPPSTTRSSSGRSTRGDEPAARRAEARARAARRARPPEEEGGVGGSTRAMRLDEVEWEDVEDPPQRRDDEA